MKTANFPKIEYQEIARLNPYWSSWVWFCEATKKRGLHSKTIRKHFNSLVNKGDYARGEKFQLLNYLYQLSGD